MTYIVEILVTSYYRERIGKVNITIGRRDLRGVKISRPKASVPSHVVDACVNDPKKLGFIVEDWANIFFKHNNEVGEGGMNKDRTR